jgi:hypothetical protein
MNSYRIGGLGSFLYSLDFFLDLPRYVHRRLSTFLELARVSLTLRFAPFFEFLPRSFSTFPDLFEAGSTFRDLPICLIRSISPVALFDLQRTFSQPASVRPDLFDVF